ncbi:hypothetical protein OG806_36060 [Streptomyces sp. NBC_00882]|uniref:hypothetical protein n=1 Tax=Streptomyces sp. NBC_00882 TaxID=2975856 RepID=UPI003866A3BC|nr:hypothetical protein OG806_36060 [Streptomyces sp. NBC_00882]
MQHVLVPDDLFFLSAFLLLEPPLLRLDQAYSKELDAQTVAVVSNALNSWYSIVDRLPSSLKLDQPQSDTGENSRQGYELHDPRGRQLTSLYLQEDWEGELQYLKTCHSMLKQAEAGQARDDALPEVLDELEESLLRNERLKATEWIEAFGRALAVMQLPVPPLLKASLKLAAPSGKTVGITLDAEQAAEYQQLADEIVSALSSGHHEAYNTHRALYTGIG